MQVPVVSEVDGVRGKDTLEWQRKRIREASFRIKRLVVRRRQLRVQNQGRWPGLAMERLLCLGIDDIHGLKQASAHTHVCADRSTAVRVPAFGIVLDVMCPVPAAAAGIEDGA